MDFILRKDICKQFLDQYNKIIYPELFSRIIEIGILTLKLSFGKLAFSPGELDDIINSLKDQLNQEQAIFRLKKLKKLTNRLFKPEKIEKMENIEQEKIKNNTISYDDNSKYEHFFINTTNFYDSDYFIPETKYFRNKQLYQKRLENPLFVTQNKNVYPFWWWNLPEQDDSEENDKEKDKYYDSNYMSKSQSISKNSYYDETKIFHNNYYNDNDNNYNYNGNDSDINNHKECLNTINRSNYKISFDKNLNVIGVKKTGGKIKSIGNK